MALWYTFRTAVIRSDSSCVLNACKIISLRKVEIAKKKIIKKGKKKDEQMQVYVMLFNPHRPPITKMMKHKEDRTNR